MDLILFIERLDQSTNTILQAAKACPPEQLQVNNEGKWSMLDIIEHLYLTDKVIFTIISRPSETIHADSEIIGNEKLHKILVERRSHTIIAPEILQPKGVINDLDTLLDFFVSQRNTLKNNLLSNKLIVDNRVHAHPFLGAMTIADWLNFTTHHTQRHLEQIKDL